MNDLVMHWLSTGFAIVALAVAVPALVVALLKFRAPRKLQLAMEDYEHDIESIRSSLKRLNARVGMREARDANHAKVGSTASDDEWSQRPGESNDDWKARIRKGPLRRGVKPQ